MSFQSDSGKYKVLYKNLCYRETEKRNILLHFEISALLLAKPQSACPHRSFVVNMSYVKGVEGLELVMTSGKRIPVSQPKRRGIINVE